jgi:hypothetical protein
MISLADHSRPFKVWMNWEIALTDGMVENVPFFA